MQKIELVIFALKNRKLWSFIARHIFLTLGINIVVGLVVLLSGGVSSDSLSTGIAIKSGPLLNNSFGISLLLYCLIIPIAETFVFQQLPYLFMINKRRMVLFSGLFFGACHFYDLPYFIASCFVGAVLMKAYINWGKEKPHRFLVVTIIHALHNFITITGLQLFNL